MQHKNQKNMNTLTIIRHFSQRTARFTMAFLLAVMTTTTAGAQTNTLVSHIDYCKAGVASICISGWVYDNDVNTIRTWELGSGIEVYAFVTTDPDETFDDYDYNLPIPNEIEYVVREDVNSAYGLTGNHGFKAIVPLLPTSFEDDMEHIFYVKIYAKFNPGTGSQYVVLHSAAVTVRMNLGEGSE